MTITAQTTSGTSGPGITGTVAFSWAVHGTIPVSHIAAQITVAGSAIRLRAVATDPTSGQTVSFSAAGLPPGVSISPAGVITGWPAAGTYRVTVTAADSLQAQGAASFTGTVRVVADGTPRIRGKCLATGRPGTKNRTRVGLQPCTGGAAQRWMVQSGGELVNGKSGTCLANPGSSSRNGGGAAAGLPRTSSPARAPEPKVWHLNADNAGVRVKSVAAGLCLADPGDAAANGTALEVLSCTSGDPGLLWRAH